MDLKDPDYVMIIKATYGTEESLEGLDMQWRYKRSGRQVVNKWFKYCEVFGN